MHPDAEGGYTVLLGETTLGGLPADIVAPGGIHWLGVQVSGQPEQPRMLLVELPSALKSDPINSRPAAASRGRRCGPPSQRKRDAKSRNRTAHHSPSVDNVSHRDLDDLCGSGQMVEKANGAIRTSAFSQSDKLCSWPREALARNSSALVSSLGL